MDALRIRRRAAALYATKDDFHLLISQTAVSKKHTKLIAGRIPNDFGIVAGTGGNRVEPVPPAGLVVGYPRETDQFILPRCSPAVHVAPFRLETQQ
jgi:hypothetical protein